MKIFGLQRIRGNGKYLENRNISSMGEKKNGKGKGGKNFGGGKHIDRLCKDRTRILDSKFLIREPFKNVLADFVR